MPSETEKKKGKKMIKGSRAASSYGLLRVRVLRPCCPISCQPWLNAVSPNASCVMLTMPPLMGTCGFSVGQVGCQLACRLSVQVLAEGQVGVLWKAELICPLHLVQRKGEGEA